MRLGVRKSQIKEAALLLSLRLENWRYRQASSLPDFVGIGVEKCGTTWLHEVLLRHPQLFVPESKEIDYFSRGLANGLRWYGDHFRDAGDRLRGEISPTYSHISYGRISLMRSIMPNVRLIIFLRNPIDRAWSHAFMSLVKQRNRSLDEVSEEEFLGLLDRPGFRKLGDYPEILGQWLDVFSKEQLFIGLYDDISRSPKALLERVFQHIGVTSNVDWEMFPYAKVIVPPAGQEYKDHDRGRGVIADKHVNSATRMPPRVRDHLLETYAPDIATLLRDYELAVGHWGS